MADFRSSAIIDKPVHEVFQYVASMEHMPEIMPNVVKVEKLTEGDIGKGTLFKETRQVRGTTISADIEVLEFEQDKLFKTSTDSNGLITEYVYTFHEIAEGTQVELDAFIKTTGLRMKLTKGLIVKMIKREDGFQLEYLKEVLEK